MKTLKQLRSMSIIVIFVLLLTPLSSAAQTTRKQVDLIMEGDQVVTLDAKQPVIEKGAVAIDAGAIVAVGKASEIRAAYDANLILPGKDRVLMPGLVNGHTHLAMVMFRGLADDLALNDWLTKYIFPAEGQFVNEEFVRIGVQLACWEMIRGGTTTFVDMYFYPDVEAEVIEQCGLRGVIAPSTIDFPSPGFKGWDDAFASAVDFAKRWKGKNERIIPAIGVHAPYTVSPEHLQQAAKAAKELGVPISIHVSETLTEVEDVQKRYNNRPVNHLNALGFLDVPVIAGHMVHPDKDEIKVLAQKKVGAIHNPSSNMKLASGFSPVVAMLAAGVNVGLATDGAASNNDLDMWEEMNLAALIHKGNQLDPTVMPASVVLKMATLGGAEAIGLGKQIGAITVGRRADLIQVRLDQPRVEPLYNVISHLVYSVNSDDVDSVVVNGKVLMQNGEVLTLDIDQVRADAEQLAAKISAAIKK